jgi:hypothetical protein
MSDGLIEPLNAPPPVQLLTGGVQAGVTGPVTYSTAVVVYGAGGLSGIFIYSGTPTFGNLIGSWTAGPGTSIDPYGNTVNPGLVVGENSVSPIDIVNNGGQGQIQFLNSGFTQSFIYSGTIGSGTGTSAFLAIQGPANQVATFGDLLNDTFNSNSSAGSNSANRVVGYVDANGVGHTIFIADCTGLNLPVVKNLSAVLPGTGTSRTNAAQAEGWHGMVCNGSWTLVRGPYYQLQPNNTVLVVGAATHAAFTGTLQLSNTTIDSAVTNQGYWPNNTWNIGGPGIPGRAGCEITAGGIVIAVAGTATCTEVDISGIYPLGL